MPAQKYIFAFLFFTLIVFLNLSLQASEPITVSVNIESPGIKIPDDALGLSYETFEILPDANGEYYFDPENKPLVTLFKTLGIRNLRIGGNSVDAANIPLPSEKDIRTFFEFAKKVDVKVIYSLRLQDADPEYAARMAKVIRNCNAGTLQYFSIGNEPGYYKDYQVYTKKWMSIRDAMLKEFPDALFCGPDQNPSPDLNPKLIRDFGGKAGRLAMITQHSYPMGCSYKNPSKDVSKMIPKDAEESRKKMLMPSVWETYAEIHEKMTRGLKGFPYRLTEVNSYWYSGLKGASNSHASALWGIDYLYWWISHGSQGLNFHTGDTTGGSITLPCQYAAFVSSLNGYEVRPLGYAMKLFDLGGGGQLLPVVLSSTLDQGIVAYATLDASQCVFVTLINRNHGEDDENTEIHIKLDRVFDIAKTQIISLVAPNGDIAATSGLTLGGASIQEDGSWDGQWAFLENVDGDDAVASVIMPPASAAVVKLSF